MYKDHELFESPEDENTIIWRYLDFTKFVSMLDKQALFFTRASKMVDDFEGSIPRTNIRDRLNDVEKIDGKSELLKLISAIFEKYVETTFLNCWHINEYESAAMWKLYLKSDEGVAIQSTFKRLKDCFNEYKEGDVFIGKVKYIDYKTERIPEGNSFSPFLHKRKSFDYESELRAIIQKNALTEYRLGLEKDTRDSGMDISVELDVLVQKIFISPTASESFTDLVKSVINKYNLNKNVSHSSLTEDPLY